MYEETKPELDNNFIDVRGLKPGEMYEFVVVAVDGDTMKESDTVEIEASSSGILLKHFKCNSYILLIYIIKNKNNHYYLFIILAFM